MAFAIQFKTVSGSSITFTARPKVQEDLSVLWTADQNAIGFPIRTKHFSNNGKIITEHMNKKDKVICAANAFMLDRKHCERQPVYGFFRKDSKVCDGFCEEHAEILRKNSDWVEFVGPAT